ncbi:glycosyltransferase family 4 protein [Actinomycetaceae bacterium L2_0104]
MRIGYLLPDPGIGIFGAKGASVHAQEIVRALRAAGHEVIVFCVRLDQSIPTDLADLEARHFPLPTCTSTVERERAISGVAQTIARQARNAELDCVYERYSLFSSAGADVARSEAIPFVLEVNAPLIEEQRRYRELVEVERAWEATRAQFSAATVISCVSSPVAEWARQLAKPENVVVIPNGVNTERISPAPTGETPDESGRAVKVGFVGTLKPWHGTGLLIEAVARMDDDTELVLCGDGPDREALEHRAERIGVANRVRFLGSVAPAQVPRVLRDLDIAVAPYPAGEHYFSPLKLYEYMAAGLPIVASAIGEIPETLEHGTCGMLVPAGDVDELANALRRLARDSGLRRRLGEAARESAREKHDWRARVGTLMGLVE